MAEDRKPDPRLIWDLEKDLDITQAGERRPLRRWMMRSGPGRLERDVVAEVDRALRVSGERGFL
jgi:hypothetical protein